MQRNCTPKMMISYQDVDFTRKDLPSLLKRKALPCFVISKLLGFNNLTVFVVTTAGAHAMRKLHFATLRANGAGRSANAIVSAATSMSAGAASSLFRYCHDLFSFFMKPRPCALNNF
jgi:hypothetical protein